MIVASNFPKTHLSRCKINLKFFFTCISEIILHIVILLLIEAPSRHKFQVIHANIFWNSRFHSIFSNFMQTWFFGKSGKFSGKIGKHLRIGGIRTKSEKKGKFTYSRIHAIKKWIFGSHKFFQFTHSHN